jgi:hypothetical protein
MNNIGFVLRLIVLSVTYALLAHWVLNYSTVYGNATVIWLPGGLGLAALLMAGRHYWPFIFTGGDPSRTLDRRSTLGFGHDCHREYTGIGVHHQYAGMVMERLR